MRNTKKFLTALAVIICSAVQITPVMAEKGKPLLDRGKFSIGAGISNNSVGGSVVGGPIDDELGYQFFGAYDLSMINLMDGVDSSVEFGVMDYGFSRDSTGIWGTFVVDGNIGGGFGWLARLGLDLGDDSGLMVGAGAAYKINKRIDIRLEYVVRDEVDSLQFNVLYRL